MRTWICSLFTVAIISLSMPAFANDPACRDTQLGETMDEVKTQFRAFVRAYKAGDSNTQRQAVAELVRLAQLAEGEQPLKAETVSDSRRQAMIDGYKKDIAKLTGMFTELQEYVSAGENDEIAFLLDDIQQHNRSSHREYRLKCDD